MRPVDPESLLRQSFGLNSYEARAYLSLLSKPLRAKDVSDESGVPLSRTYDTLRKLVSKGFAKVTDGTFAAVRPSVALKARLGRYSEDFAEAQEGRAGAMGQLVAGLERLYSEGAAPGKEPLLLKGIDGIGSAFIEVLSKSRDVYLLVRQGVKARWRFLTYVKGAAPGRRRTRVLIPREVRLSKSDLAAASEAGLDIRTCDGVMLDVMVGEKADVMIGVPAKGKDQSFGAVAIWVRDPSFAMSIRKTAEQLWRKGEKARA